VWPSYSGLGGDFRHAIIDHARSQHIVGSIHANTIEGFWSLVKHGMYAKHNVSLEAGVASILALTPGARALRYFQRHRESRTNRDSLFFRHPLDQRRKSRAHLGGREMSATPMAGKDPLKGMGEQPA
jgi:hypothetical protein